MEQRRPNPRVLTDIFLPLRWSGGFAIQQESGLRRYLRQESLADAWRLGTNQTDQKRTSPNEGTLDGY
jgi:hypothetical protein